MRLPDEDMERRLERFRRRPAPAGLKDRILGECRRRASAEAGRLITRPLWIALAVECLALFFVLVTAPGRADMGKYAEMFVSPALAESSADSVFEEAEVIGETAGLSDAEKARLVRRLSLGRAEEPRPARPFLSKSLEALHEYEN